MNETAKYNNIFIHFVLGCVAVWSVGWLVLIGARARPPRTSYIVCVHLHECVLAKVKLALVDGSVVVTLTRHLTVAHFFSPLHAFATASCSLLHTGKYAKNERTTTSITANILKIIN